MHISDRRKKLVLETSLLHNDFVLTLEKKQINQWYKNAKLYSNPKGCMANFPLGKIGCKTSLGKRGSSFDCNLTVLATQ